MVAENNIMRRAILKNGVIHPLEPLPPEWRDGQEVRIELAEDEQRHLTPEEFERSWRELEELCAEADPEEDERMMQTMAESKRQAKEWMRKRMGLAE
jgi:hypothetical protein